MKTNNKTSGNDKSVLDATTNNINKELLQLIKEAEIDLTQDVQKPPVVLKLDDENLFFLGDFSMTLGRAKSRKTFFTSLLMSVLVGNIHTGRITAHLPKDKKAVLYFDTEQGLYHAYQSAKRVHSLLGIKEADNFRAFSLRQYKTSERLNIIEFWIYHTPNLGVVFIDGIRDLVSSINDEQQATDIVNKIMKWTAEKQIHINCVLHMNKNDMNARGHLGTELLNKSLVTISVAKNKAIGNYSEVVVNESREKEPAPFMFGVNDDGLPYIVPEGELPKAGKIRQIPQEYDLPGLKEILRSKIFSSKTGLTYSEITKAVQKEFNIGENKAKKYVGYFRQQNLINSRKHGNSTIYSLV